MFGLLKKPELEVIHSAIAAPNRELPVISLPAERHTLAKRRWRGTADDGREFGFDLEQPLRHGDVFFQGAAHQYVLAQIPENVLRVPLASPAEAARLAWQVGNLHFRVMIDGGCLLVEDDPALRQMLEREGFAFTPARSIFQPLTGSHGHHPHLH